MLRLDFTKFTSTCSPLLLYPELAEETSWLLPEALPEEVAPDQLRRYVLLMFSANRKNPCRELTDLGKRRERALQGAGVTRRLWATPGWQQVLDFTCQPALPAMVAALYRREQDRLYERWLSYLMAHATMMSELREGVDPATTEADKKTQTIERKLKISNGMDKLVASLDEMEKKLFEGDEPVREAITALGQKESARKGGWAERFSS